LRHNHFKVNHMDPLTALRIKQATAEAGENGGLDEYAAGETGGYGNEDEETGNFDGDEEGQYDMGGYDMGGVDDDEDGGFDDDEDGGIDDDDEGGGFDSDSSVQDFVEHGGKKKKKKRRLFQRPKKNKKKKKKLTRNDIVRKCQELGYGDLLIGGSGMSIGKGLPYLTVSKGVRIITSPIPLENRIPQTFLQHGLRNTGLRTSQTPVYNASAPAAGAYSLTVAPTTVGTLIEAMGLALDIGPQPLSTQAGAPFSVAISGWYVDGEVATLGTFNFLIPSTNRQMRIVFFFYKLVNSAPRPKMMFACNAYTNPYQATADNVSRNLTVSGIAPAGLALNATILGPGNITYENLLASGNKRCGC
jgi:hypothetical protein